MRLAEALKLRADTNVRLRELKSRLEDNSKVQEGDVPSEDPRDLLAEMEELSAQLEELIWRINTTNCNTVGSDGTTLTQMIARRDVLTVKESIVSGLIESASKRVNRYSNSEIVVRSTIDVRAMRKRADALSAEIRRTDLAIQELNWTTELL